ncbi:MAG: PD40 domain-containing protein [Acidobacteria bacterium]|nr:PD40 domain-containing protein [Acidobacteriota bacterium]
MGDEPASQPLLNSPASEHSAAFSPDGSWLAYVSDESGRAEVYVRRHPEGEQLPVSTAGGQGPVLSRDGRTLFYGGSSKARGG